MIYALLGAAFAVAGADKMSGDKGYEEMFEHLGWSQDQMRAVAVAEMAGGRAARAAPNAPAGRGDPGGREHGGARERAAPGRSRLAGPRGLLVLASLIALAGAGPGPLDLTRSISAAMPWPTPMHIVAIARFPPQRLEALTAVSASRAPDMPERMAERDRAAVRVHVLGVVRQAELAQHRDALGGERLVQFDHVDVASVSPSRASSFCTAGAGPMPMMRGATPAVAIATTRARGVRPWRLAASSRGEQQRAAPSLTPEALPAVTVPRVAERRPQLRQHLERGVGARMLVRVDRRSRPCGP